MLKRYGQAPEAYPTGARYSRHHWATGIGDDNRFHYSKAIITDHDPKSPAVLVRHSTPLFSVVTTPAVDGVDIIPRRHPANVPHQPVLALLVHCVALVDVEQAVPHQHLIVTRRQERGGDVDEHGDGRVPHVGERLLSEKDCRNNTCPQVTSQVRADGNVGKAPYHGSVRETNDERGAGGADKGIRRVETRPDDDADEGVDKELGEEHVSQVCLVRVGEGAEDAGRRAVGHEGLAGGEELGLHLRYLRPVHAHDDKPRHESAEYLTEDVVRHLLRREPLPDPQSDGHGRVEVATRRRGAGDNGKGNAQGKRPADLEEAAKGGDADWAGGVEREGGDGGYSGEDVEEDARGLGHALTEPSRTTLLIVELALGDGLGGNDVSSNVSLDSMGHTQLH